MTFSNDALKKITVYKLIHKLYQNDACELKGKDTQFFSQVLRVLIPLSQSYLTSGLVLSSSPH